MTFIVTPERPDSPDAVRLIAELDSALSNYPVESRHGFSVDKLLREGVHFFVARHEGVPAGCGGVLFVGTDYAEVKRMYVRPDYRGTGLGRVILNHLIDHARDNGFTLIRLETGIHQEAAIKLYTQAGFYRIPPFGPYFEDPVSLCFEKRLS